MSEESESSPSILTRKWRYFPFKKYDPYLKIALNEVALASVSQSGTPIVWFIGWDRNCVSIGNQQKISDVVNLSEVKKRDLTIVRRQTNGGAMYLDRDGELSWALIAPNELLPKDNLDAIKFCADKVCTALQELGMDAYFKNPNDIFTTLGKISTIGIKRERYSTYIGGTLIFTANIDAFKSVLTPEGDLSKQKRSPEKFKPLTAISLETEKTKEETLKALSVAFLEGLEYKTDSWSEQELSDAQTLADRYRGEEWLRTKL
jgi:lipoate-protein ligase A